jgi:hydrogenase nickel incorporation protein HypA/HybF
MHEIGILENTLEIALKYAKTHQATQIHSMTLKIGTLSGVEPEALSFAFDVVVKETIAAQAKLNIQRIKALCYCSHCQAEFEPRDWIYECPNCHQLSWQLLQGKELELASMEIS